MAVFEAEAINALHFFHLIFGLSSESLESRWMPRGIPLSAIAKNKPSPNGLFFNTSFRQQFEALYLTLSFLEEISRLVFPRLSALRHPDLGLSLDTIRMSFNDRPSRLPYLWNFTVEWIGGDIDAGLDCDIHRPDGPPSYGIFYVGAIQCAAMMARRHRTPASLAGAMASMLQDLDSHRTEQDMSSLAAVVEKHFCSQVMGAEKWPEPVGVLYRQAFQLGVDLIRESLNGRCPTRDEFFDSLERLKTVVWKHLFDVGPSTGKITGGRDDARILEVLTGVMKRWRAEPSLQEGAAHRDQRKSVDSAAGDDGTDDDLGRTLVLNPRIEGSSTAPAAEDVLETMIIGPRGISHRKPSGDGLTASGRDTSSDIASGNEGDEPMMPEAADFPETVILSASGKGPSASGKTIHDEVDATPTAVEGLDDFPETVVISPPGDGYPEHPGTAATPPFPPDADIDDDETAVVKKTGGPPPPPPGRPGKMPRKDENEADDDIIFETVIIRPGSLHENQTEE